MTLIENVRPGPADQLRQLTPDTYRRAYDDGMSLSAYLERENPSAEYRDGLDAFERIVQAAEIRTQSIPEMGVWAQDCGAFFDKDETRMLFPEWCNRQYRRAMTGRSPNTRALYATSDNALGGAMNPYFDAAGAVVNNLAPAIPIAQLVARTVGINTDVYRSFYLTDVTAQERMVRVGEGAEIPRVKLAGGDHTIRLKKYGRVMEISYELLRRQQIDLVALHIAQLAAQTETDRLAAGLTILESGDGNSGTAATSYNLTTLDAGATAGTLTLKAWLAFKMKFLSPFVMTTAIAPEAMALQLQLLNTGSANIPLVALAGQPFGGFTPINPGLADNVALGWDSNATANKIIGFDRRWSLLYLTEVGSDISEIESWATRQVRGVVISEVNGFSTLNASSVRILNVAA